MKIFWNRVKYLLLYSKIQALPYSFISMMFKFKDEFLILMKDIMLNKAAERLTVVEENIRLAHLNQIILSSN